MGKRQEDERRNPAKASMETPILLAGNLIARGLVAGEGRRHFFWKERNTCTPKIAFEDLVGQSGGILVQNIMEGYIMAFINIMISFKEIEICLEKVELGWVSNGASLTVGPKNNRSLDPLDKLSANMGIDKGGPVYVQLNKRFK